MLTLFKKAVACTVLMAVPAVSNAQSAGTYVDVGPGFAGAGGQASGQWQFIDSNSRVHNGLSTGNAIAVGAGPNGLALSHSIGIHGGGAGKAHNFNLAIGRGGAHVSNGGVSSQGANSRVNASGFAQSGPFGPQGGSTVAGFGNRTRAYSNSRTTSRNDSGFFQGGPRAFVPGQLPAGPGALSAQGFFLPRQMLRNR